MKKISIIFFTIILSIIVVGCSSKNHDKSDIVNQQYEQHMADGKSKVIEEEYNKAIDYFNLALESKQDDEEATNLISQLDLLVESINLEDQGVYFYQLEQLEKIFDIETKTDVVKNKAEDYSKKIISDIDILIDGRQDEIEEGNYTSAQRELEIYISQCKKIDALKSQLERCNELLANCKDMLAEDEKIEWCITSHYVSSENYVADEGRCRRCSIMRYFASTNSNRNCPNCNTEYVDAEDGVCYNCKQRVLPSVTHIYENGTVVYEAGSELTYEEIMEIEE